MVSVQPILSFKYFCLKKSKTPEGIKKLFYLSWEDALWDILIHKNVKKGSAILVPDFYCSDVEENITNHGYKIARYRINPDLSADKKSFSQAIKNHKPAVVIVFHPVGIKSNLLDNPGWLAKTSGDSILVEDAVHRALDANDFEIFKKNHFVMDSLRKVVPLQGCRLYGKADDLNFEVPRFAQSFRYHVKVNFNCILMSLCWTFGFYKLAEKLMDIGYDIIGDADLPARGSVFAKLLSDRLNIKRIQELKKKQVDFYEHKLKAILPVRLELKEKDKKHLRGYPVILPVGNTVRILSCLRKNSLFIRFELEGSPWSNRQKIIYLPLGFQMSKKSQNKLCDLVKKAFAI